jgi:hypothetical protein
MYVFVWTDNADLQFDNDQQTNHKHYCRPDISIQSRSSIPPTSPMAAGTTSEILTRITQRAQDCLALPSMSLSRSLTPQYPHSPQRPITEISLPDAPSIQSALTAAGAAPGISLAISQAYQKRAAELRALCCSSVARVYSNQAQYPSEHRYVTEQKVLSTFTELYLRELVAWREQAVAAYLKHSSTSNTTHTSSCTVKFNHVRLISYLDPSSLL